MQNVRTTNREECFLSPFEIVLGDYFRINRTEVCQKRSKNGFEIIIKLNESLIRTLSSYLITLYETNMLDCHILIWNQV